MVVVAALGLVQRDLRLLQRVGGVGGVDGVENGALLHLIPLLKGGGEDAALDEGGHRVGVGRLQGAAAGDGGGDVHAGDLRRGIGGSRRRGALTGAEHLPAYAGRHDQGHAGHGKFLPAALLPGLFVSPPRQLGEQLGRRPRGGQAFLDGKFHIRFNRPFRGALGLLTGLF